jgi:hypothetical protein
MIIPFDLNSVGAPYETPIICPAQPPRILSSSTWREILRSRPRSPFCAREVGLRTMMMNSSVIDIIRLYIFVLLRKQFSVFSFQLPIENSQLKTEN